jgi:hypothetical protein
MRGPCWPSACDGDAKPRSAAARCCLGPARPMALGSLRTVRGLPAVCALTRSTLPWWSTGLPGRPTPDSLPACSKGPSASARPSCPRPGVAHAGRSPRDGACYARRSPREAPPGAGAAPRLPVGAQLPCSRWDLASVTSRPHRRSGGPSRCQPSSATRPSQWPRSAWSVMGQWRAATLQPLRIDSAAWSGVGRVGSRAAVARCPPAPMLTAAAAVLRHGGSPAARAARRALRPHRLWTTWWGRTSAAS